VALTRLAFCGKSGAHAWVSDGGEAGSQAEGRGSSQEASEAKDVSCSYCRQEGEERRGWSQTLERNARASVGSARCWKDWTMRIGL